MYKTVIISLLLLVATTSCENKKKPQQVIKKVIEVSDINNIQESEGYKLMEQKCFVCHFPVPNPEKKEEMIAPPMLRIQEHYKPAYPNKEDFINAIKSWVKEPTEEKIQMPGAARKFEIMPYLSYSDTDITLIAEALYEIDLGDDLAEHHGKNQKLQLNKGEKWKLDKSAIDKIENTIVKLELFKSEKVSDYQNFGKELFTTAKSLLLDKKNKGEKLVQIQAFFHNIEADIHNLIEVRTVKEGIEIQNEIKKKFTIFFNYFE